MLGRFGEIQEKKRASILTNNCSGSHCYPWQSNVFGQNTSYLVEEKVSVRHYHKNFIKIFKSQA